MKINRTFTFILLQLTATGLYHSAAQTSDLSSGNCD